jgi:hypothetical protein
MRMDIGRLALAMACLAAAPVVSEETQPVVVPVFDELIKLNIPADFAPAYSAANDSAVLWEAIPKGDTVENWTEMITVSAAKDSGYPGALEFTRYLASGYLNACPTTFGDVDFGQVEVPGSADGYAKWVSCGTVLQAPVPRSEAAVIIVIKGKAMYSVQWAERGPASAGDLPKVEESLLGRLEKLQDGLRLCSAVPGETAPYPSCE